MPRRHCCHPARSRRIHTDGLLTLARLAPAVRQQMGEPGRACVMERNTYPVLAARFLEALQGSRRS